jgi:predicted amidohydrolase
MSDIKRVAIAQISAKKWDLDYNAKKVISIIKQNKDADIVVFPELILQGHHHEIHKKAADSSVDVGVLEKIEEVCNDYETSTVVGGLEVVNGKHYNCAFYIDGNKVERYIKSHVHWTEEFTPGNRLECFDSTLGKMGVLICFDIAFPEVGRSLALMGAKVFVAIAVIPWKFDRKYVIRRLQGMAIDNQVFIIYANKWKKGKFNGYSCIIDPRGRVVKKMKDKQGVLRAKIDLDEIDKWREEEKIFENRRPELYSKITSRKL